MEKFTVQLMTEFGTSPVWVLEEDHIPCQEGFLPIIEKDPEIRELSKRIGDSLPVVSLSGERVSLGFSNNVRCKGIDVGLYDDGVLIVFSSESPTDWRKAGDILFGYDEDVNLLAIMFTSTSKPDMELIEEYLKEQR